ncbi:MAG: hypothetical protein LBR06_02100 [Bacteroidales bacterium]|nr:hypothetical protein [Bacteroidales bacterium]
MDFSHRIVFLKVRISDIIMQKGTLAGAPYLRMEYAQHKLRAFLCDIETAGKAAINANPATADGFMKFVK